MNRIHWLQHIRRDCAVLWWLKAAGTTVYMVLFFQAYFHLLRQPARAVFQPNGGATDDLRGDPADASGRRGVNVASGESDCPAVDANENPTFFIA